ncbi:dihydrodipicolinate synthase family protein [Streptomyces alfalfae]|uniref:Dihydrodipicolinate synthase family protein n=1 Tax=Streptomyces alfalfae TaxID=1642299 RepID=A0A1P8TKT3_9ACTN|nr:dihydrodipicolinate synthase family protein [Streptomyces alfalfae]AYA18656.1 dihydrodipicolinate synthase family protein [Streptomyces fradiae]APY88260.1 dihydrodipicolinate synthase family protein [Streptomyces alfalfae]QQC89378.1 dihydrodipicolinate synthase family protein [Streptomyces alfalfae]QUI31829.1 dihydrodipicolinate synthase family protein [Streptomyces alfalfae]RXX46464.1 dihydrodipicolinate synthase family protein [Streptomyces alfalfae]
MTTLLLPVAGGGTRAYTPRAEPARLTAGGPPLTSRTVFSAAHVVADPFADVSPDGPAAVDWDATLAFRRHLWSHGLGVAEAMDTAQRGMGLDWQGAAELIRRSAGEAKAAGGRIACGVGTDQLTVPATLPQVVRAYEEQLALVEEAGAQVILMASRALAAAAASPDDYLETYGHLLRQASEPVILHWLGPMFDPALEGYWGSADLDAATETFLAVIAAHPDKVDGIKVSLLDAGREVALRRRLPRGVRCYTGDDFHYPELIAGDDHGFSHALLGIFDPLGPLAAEAVRMLDTGDVTAFRGLLDPTVELSRHLFQAPTRYYKTGVVLLAWLAGHQTHFSMVGGLQSARSLPHLARAYELADGLGLFPDPSLAAARMRALLTVHGVPR